MKTRTKNIIIAALVVALLFSTATCTTIKSTAYENERALTDTLRYYTNALGVQTVSIRTLQADKTQLKQLVLNKDKALATLAKGFSKVHSVTKYNTVTVVDTINVRYIDTVPCTFQREGVVKNAWYGFKYRSDQNGISIDSLTLPNTAIVITGTKRKWFLGKETLVTEVTNTNPYLRTTQLTAAEIPQPVPVYKKWYLWLAVGIAGGFVLAK